MNCDAAIHRNDCALLQHPSRPNSIEDYPFRRRTRALDARLRQTLCSVLDLLPHLCTADRVHKCERNTIIRPPPVSRKWVRTHITPHTCNVRAIPPTMLGLEVKMATRGTGAADTIVRSYRKVVLWCVIHTVYHPLNFVR